MGVGPPSILPPNTKLLSKGIVQKCTFPPAIYESSGCSTSLPTFGAARL